MNDLDMDEYFDGPDTDIPTDEYFKYEPSFDGYTLTQNTRIERTTKVMELAEYIAFANEPRPQPNGKYLGRRVNNAIYMSGDRVLVQYESYFKGDAKTKAVKLPAGIYNVVVPHGGMIILQKYKFSADEYVPLADNTQDIINEIDRFLGMKEHYQKMGLVHKRGLLLYGPPGTGKTRLIEHIAKQFVDRARVLFMSHAHVGNLGMLKGKLDDMPTIVMLEEFTEQGGSNAVLGFLDGEQSWDSCLVLATTNYPHLIPGNIIDRPSRFDKLFKLDNPKAETRRAYLEVKLGKERTTDKLVELTEGMSIAYLRELVVSVQIFDRDPIETLLEFQQRKEEVKTFCKLNPHKPMGEDNE